MIDDDNNNQIDISNGGGVRDEDGVEITEFIDDDGDTWKVGPNGELTMVVDSLKQNNNQNDENTSHNNNNNNNNNNNHNNHNNQQINPQNLVPSQSEYYPIGNTNGLPHYHSSVIFNNMMLQQQQQQQQLQQLQQQIQQQQQQHQQQQQQQLLLQQSQQDPNHTTTAQLNLITHPGNMLQYDQQNVLMVYNTIQQQQQQQRQQRQLQQLYYSASASSSTTSVSPNHAQMAHIDPTSATYQQQQQQQQQQLQRQQEIDRQQHLASLLKEARADLITTERTPYYQEVYSPTLEATVHMAKMTPQDDIRLDTLPILAQMKRKRRAAIQLHSGLISNCDNDDSNVYGGIGVIPQHLFTSSIEDVPLSIEKSILNQADLKENGQQNNALIVTLGNVNFGQNNHQTSVSTSAVVVSSSGEQSTEWSEQSNSDVDVSQSGSDVDLVAAHGWSN